MALQKEHQDEIVDDYQVHETDTGSPEVQIALLTERIAALPITSRSSTRSSFRRGLFKMVGRRRRLLRYLSKKDTERYRTLIERLGLRR